VANAKRTRRRIEDDLNMENWNISTCLWPGGRIINKLIMRPSGHKQVEIIQFFIFKSSPILLRVLLALAITSAKALGEHSTTSLSFSSHLNCTLRTKCSSSALNGVWLYSNGELSFKYHGEKCLQQRTSTLQCSSHYMNEVRERANWKIPISKSSFIWKTRLDRWSANIGKVPATTLALQRLSQYMKKSFNDIHMVYNWKIQIPN
jgi:hypothetical protein